MRRFAYFIPVALFAVLIGFFVYRLAQMEQGKTPDILPSALIGQAAPSFDLPALLSDRPGLKTADFQGKVTLVNFFASWCVPCRLEHPYLSQLKDIDGLRLVGINYKNESNEATAWIAKVGNPYQAIGVDRNGATGIDFGVYGVPESYVIDKQGVIRFKQAGPLTPEDIKEKILPLIKELNR